MTKLTVRIRDKDIGKLNRLAKDSELELSVYVEEVIETWLAQVREKERWVRVEAQVVRRSSSLIAPHAIPWLK